MAKILIAEDERDIRDLVAFTLRFAGYEVVTAANGEEAVLLTPKENPDLILMDVRMPRMTGYDACRVLKANPDLKDIPVVFLLFLHLTHPDESSRHEFLLGNRLFRLGDDPGKILRRANLQDDRKFVLKFLLRGLFSQNGFAVFSDGDEGPGVPLSD